MEKELKPIKQGPAVHGKSQLQLLMLKVVLALSPALIWAFYVFGWAAFIALMLTCVSGFVFEWVALRLRSRGRTRQAYDGSGLLSCILLAMSLPPMGPWWLYVLGSFVSIVITKQLFGGLGQNVFNPAMSARVFLLLSCPAYMTAWLDPDKKAGLVDTLRYMFIDWHRESYDALTTATTLDAWRNAKLTGLPLPQPELTDMFVGSTAGSMGEVSAMLLLLGGMYLLFSGIIRWHLPAGFLAGVMLPATLFWLLGPEGTHLSPLVYLVAGSTMMGAFFIVTDPVTAPVTPHARFVFAFLIGALSYLIPAYGLYPVGLSFAVLLMNSTVPLLERLFRPRIFGR
ncbi:MAG: RnfABCDGE type electron transport complex subunit D [Proteobacteria bacterium]|nr:RnfABCDGE type electron transport complex subunit D [Pseudomonadota bacterium]